MERPTPVGVYRSRVSAPAARVGIGSRRSGRLPHAQRGDERRPRQRGAPQEPLRAHGGRFGGPAGAQERSDASKAQTSECEHDRRLLRGCRSTARDVATEAGPVTEGSDGLELHPPSRSETLGKGMRFSEGIQRLVIGPKRDQGETAGHRPRHPPRPQRCGERRLRRQQPRHVPRSPQHAQGSRRSHIAQVHRHKRHHDHLH
jgi:hypothetical protein